MIKRINVNVFVRLAIFFHVNVSENWSVSASFSLMAWGRNDALHGAHGSESENENEKGSESEMKSVGDQRESKNENSSENETVGFLSDGDVGENKI